MDDEEEDKAKVKFKGSSPSANTGEPYHTMILQEARVFRNRLFDEGEFRIQQVAWASPTDIMARHGLIRVRNNDAAIVIYVSRSSCKERVLL